MSKNNSHKKETSIDNFARHYYCKHARLNQLRADKKLSKKQFRIKNKKLCKEEE